MFKRCILITGSSKGLGRELAKVYAENEYDVIIHGRNEELLNNLKEEIESKGVNCFVVVGDMKDEKTLFNLSKEAVTQNISILINNASLGMNESMNEISMEKIEDILDTNLKSIIKLTKKIHPLFMSRKNGTIININTIAALKDEANQAVYRASKLGLKGFTDNLRYESKLNRVKVIGVYLGGMKTDMYDLSGRDNSKVMEPNEVARMIFDSSKDYQSLMCDEIHIGRINYDS